MSRGFDENKAKTSYFPSHKNATKLIKVARPCEDSSVANRSHSFRLRSDDGASGQAFESACIRRRVCTYGKTTVSAPCARSTFRGNPDGVFASTVSKNVSGRAAL